MLLFRSEEVLQRWCETNHRSRGEVLSVSQVWELSQEWYSNRLLVEYHGRSLAQVEAIFKQVGLVSPFWSITSPE
ncbi:MAG: alkylmercury lyase family protein [Anaerolineae bacterium]|nr:alkylmercury lyase family protein [Anaerolineae bacterium]